MLVGAAFPDRRCRTLAVATREYTSLAEVPPEMPSLLGGVGPVILGEWVPSMRHWTPLGQAWTG